ncbi:MAG: translocation/assembly module TamB domain-containing protein [Treponema sp.]
MKLSTRTKGEFLLFVCIIFFSFFAVQPVIRSLNDKLISIRDNVLAHLENNYHVRLTYEALSPSLLRGLIIRNITLYDKKTHTKIAFFEEFSIRYRFIELLKGNPATLLHSLYIKNGFVDINLLESPTFIAKLNTTRQNTTNQDTTMRQEPVNDISTIEAFFSTKLTSLSLHIQNVVVGVMAPDQTLHAHILEGLCAITPQDITVNLNTAATYHNKLYSALHNCTTVFTIEGKIEKNLTAGAGTAYFSQFSTKYVKTASAKIFISYQNHLLTATLMQNMLPLNFNVNWNTQTNAVRGTFNCREFSPLQKLTLYNTPSIIDQLFPLEITGNADFAFINNQLTWNSQLVCSVPEISAADFTLVPTTMEVSASGKDQHIEISKLNWQGTNIDVHSALAFNIDSLLPTGFVNVKTFVLPSGTPISGYVQFAKSGRSLICSMPSLKLAKGQLEAIKMRLTPSTQQLHYIVSAKDTSGSYAFDGSYTYGTENALGSLDLHAAWDAVSIANLYQLVGAVYPAAELPTNLIDPIKCTTEFHLSGNPETFSYNCIRLIVASDQNDGFYLLCSLNGNQHSLSVDDIDCLYQNIAISGNIKADFDTLQDISFESALAVNDTKYPIRGFFSDNTFTLYGDYGISMTALYDPSLGITGRIKTTGTPLPFASLFFACDSEFQYTDVHNWNVHIDDGRFYYGTPLSFMQDATRMSFSGSLGPAGLYFDNIKLGTSKDLLTGSAQATINSTDRSAHIAVALSSADQNEKIEIDTSLSLPELSTAVGSLTLENLALYRFLPDQKKDNYISVHAAFIKSPQNFSVQLSLPMLSAKIQNTDLSLSSELAIENNRINLEKTTITWGDHTLSSLTACFEILKGSGTITADYSGSFNLPRIDGTMAKNPLKAQVTASFASTAFHTTQNEPIPLPAQIAKLFTNFSTTAVLSNWQLSNIVGTTDIPIAFIRDPGVTALYAGAHNEVNGFITDDGIVALHAAPPLPVTFNLQGTMQRNELDIQLENFYANMKTVWDITGLDVVKFHAGELTGNFAITGNMMEPEFNGSLKAANIAVNSPDFIPEIFETEVLHIKAKGTTIEAPYTILNGPSTNIWASCKMEMRHWFPNEITLQCGTLDKKMGVLKTNNILFEAEGLASAAATITMTPTSITIEGEGAFDEGFFAFKVLEMDKFNKRFSAPSDMAFNMKLNLTLGQTAEFRWPSADTPIFKTYLPTTTPLTVSVDSDSESFSIKGDAKMRGGEIFYLKHNFYIREGNLAFTGKENEIDPLINLHAEIRDRDDQGEPIRYLLTAKDQPLTKFRPSLTSEPPKASHEMAQWADVLVGDFEKDGSLQNALVTSSDVLLNQIAMFKNLENRVRSFLHLDVFSFRSLLLQNAIFNLFNTNGKTLLDTSNYLDNTSVYIGKYFGSAIYADALLQLSSYNDTTLKKSTENRPVYKNILFQPEIGIEMATPFFMMRWSMAPTQLDTMFVGDTGLTFSFKHSY